MSYLFALWMTFGCMLEETASAPRPVSMTIYNDGFAVVREQIILNLKAGKNQLSVSGVTSLLEPESVILHDRTGRINLRIQEQSYRSDILTKQSMLQLFEGKKIEFRDDQSENGPEYIIGKIIRAGNDTSEQSGTSGEYDEEGNWVKFTPKASIVEVDGRVQLGLPGEPVFPKIPDHSILQPTLNWTLNSEEERKVTAELSYLSDGFGWRADYNIIQSENDAEPLDFIGRVSLTNKSGKVFSNAKVKLLAGTVRRIVPRKKMPAGAVGGGGGERKELPEQQVVGKAFDDFHLYTLQVPVDMHDQTIKQIDFLRSRVTDSTKRIVISHHYMGWEAADTPTELSRAGLRLRAAIIREIPNRKESGLGVALPKGPIRFYRKDVDGQLEFVGSAEIEHTPANEPIRVFTGFAFDINALRREWEVDKNPKTGHIRSATIELDIRNSKSVPAEVKVIEVLNSGNGSLTEKSHEFRRLNANTIEFTVPLPASKETKLRYKVVYPEK